MLKIALFLASSHGALSMIRFGRNVLLARLIGVEDYGIASTFALLMTLVDLLSDLGLGRFVVQDREGDSPRVLAAVQSLMLARGIMLAAIVFVFADPIAVLLGQPDIGWAYRIFAAVPLLRAFSHLDIVRQQRAMRFGLMIKTTFLGLLTSFAVLWPLWLWLGDFRVMLGVILVETLVQISATHLLAEKPYRLGWSGAVTARALRFGWPLMTGGMLNFAMMQGERLIVANQYTATDLGLFSAAQTIAFAPIIVVQRVVSSMVLPLLARHQDNERIFLHRAELSLEIQLVNGLTLMLGYVLAGPLLLPLIYGPEFAAGAPLVAILGITFTLRMVRVTPASISMAKGHTINLLIVNIVRFASFPAAFLIAIKGGSLEAIALTSVAGEAAALVAAYTLVILREGLGPLIARRAPVYGIAVALIMVLVALAAGLVAGPIPAIAAAILWIIVVARCRRLLGYVGNELLKLRSRSW